MYCVLLNLLRGEKPDMVYKHAKAHYRDLTCYEFRYNTKGKFYRALSYTNGVWLDASPLGPCFKDAKGLELKVAKLGDVASITEFGSMQEVLRMPYITDMQLACLYEELDKKAEDVAAQVLAKYSFDVLSTRFTMTPYPMIIATVGKGGVLYGALSIDTFGQTKLLSYTPNFYVSGMCPKSLPSFGEVRCALRG